DRYLMAGVDRQLLLAAGYRGHRISVAKVTLGDLVGFNLPGAVYAQVNDSSPRSPQHLSTNEDLRSPSIPAGLMTATQSTAALDLASAVDSPTTVPSSDGHGWWRLVAELVPDSDAILIMAVRLAEATAPGA